MISSYVLDFTKGAVQGVMIISHFFTLPGKPEEARSGVAKGSQ
jgi:predicted alpha/beta-hydrolase family hydrolase